MAYALDVAELSGSPRDFRSKRLLTAVFAVVLVAVLVTTVVLLRNQGGARSVVRSTGGPQAATAAPTSALPFILPDTKMAAIASPQGAAGLPTSQPGVETTKNTPASLALADSIRSGLGLNSSYVLYGASEITSVHAVTVVFRSPSGTVVVNEQPLTQPVPLSSVSALGGAVSYQTDPSGNALAQQATPNEIDIAAATSTGSFLSVDVFGAPSGPGPGAASLTTPLAASQVQSFVMSTLKIANDLTAASH